MRWRAAAWPVGVCLLGLVLALFAPRAIDLLYPATGWLGLALLVVAGFAHRSTGDPDERLIATAGGVLAFQAVATRYGLSSVDPGDSWAAVSTMPLIGWAVAGICLILANPWWDRRGRQPAERRLSLGVATIVFAADALLLALPPSSDEGPRLATTILTPLPTIGWIWLWVGVIAWTFVAVRRALLLGRGRDQGPFAGAAVAAVIVLLAWAIVADEPRSWTEAALTVNLVLQPLCILLLILGVTSAQRRASSRMRRSSDRAREIVEGRAEIASMVAHEVRGPVTTIRGIASTASGHYDRLSDGERQEFFDLIEQESRRLLGAVDQTSLALKVDAGSLTYQRAPAPLATIVRAGVDAAAVSAEAHRVHVVAQEDVVLLADASRLTEVVRQLVDNAAKYSPQGSPITVRAVADGADALIEVTDEGPGIPADHRAGVFERFARWRPSGYEEQPGNGLGLFISAGIVAEHEGSISIEDATGGGAVLRVRLPIE